MRSPKLVKSAVRTIDILEYIVESPDGLSLTDIQNHTRIPISSLHGLINTLVYKGYLRVGKSHYYRPGPNLAKLAPTYRSMMDLISLADPFMVKLTQLTGETISLSVLQENMILFIHKRPGKGIIQVVNPVGTLLPAHATGTGKVILAYSPESEINKIYPREELPGITPNTIVSRRQLINVLAEVRNLGYAYDEEESVTGVWAVASCIRDHDGSPLAALSIVGPLVRLQEIDTSGWHKLVKQAAEEISLLLGFHPDVNKPDFR
jgi:IclR family acetate operon transcriptional repressor